MLQCGTDDDDDKQTTEDRATQPMEAGGWVSQYVPMIICMFMINTESCVDDDILDFVDLKFDDLDPEDGLCGQEQQTGGADYAK